MGVNQSHEGVRTAQAIINLALMTGNIGRPGTGANSITGQCNAMGSRLFSNTTNLLGGRDFTNAEHRAEGRRHPRHRRGPHPRPAQPGLRPDRRGIAGRRDQGPVGHRHQPRPLVDQPARRCTTCSARSTSSSSRTCTPRTETAQLADLVLPAAGWGEKEGTFINSERRIGLIKQVARAPGPGARRLLHLQADRRRLGLRRPVRARGPRPRRCSSILQASSRAAALRHHRHRRLRAARRGGRRPVAAARRDAPAPRRRAPAVRRRRFFHPDGRARLRLRRARARCPSRPARDYPLVLLTGRGSSQPVAHRRRAPRSRRCCGTLAPGELYVEITPADAARPGHHAATSGWWSRRARGVGAGPGVRHPHRRSPGRCSCPCTTRTTNRLTFPAFDPYSRQPSYKYCAVRVERADPARKG